MSHGPRPTTSPGALSPPLWPIPPLFLGLPRMGLSLQHRPQGSRAAASSSNRPLLAPSPPAPVPRCGSLPSAPGPGRGPSAARQKPGCVKAPLPPAPRSLWGCPPKTAPPALERKSGGGAPALKRPLPAPEVTGGPALSTMGTLPRKASRAAELPSRFLCLSSAPSRPGGGVADRAAPTTQKATAGNANRPV